MPPLPHSSPDALAVLTERAPNPARVHSAGSGVPFALRLACASLLTLPVPFPGFTQNDLMDEVARLESLGSFKVAEEKLRQEIALTPPKPVAQELAFELERLERIRKDFPLTRSELFAQLRSAVKGLTAAEFEAWMKEGRFDSREIDGQQLFMRFSVANLFFRHSELAPRRIPQKDDSALERTTWMTCNAILSAARAAKRPCVLPKRFRVSMTLMVGTNAVPAGETVRAWLPAPRATSSQRNIRIVSTSSPIKHLGDERIAAFRQCRFSAGRT